jgi:prepilin-type processing-associated H-X9-DG protein
MQARRLRPRGSSVVETTIVILILGVVLSILMPAIGLLRENALSARCQQHLRTLGHGIQHYMADYRFENWLPASELPNGPLWFEKLEPFVSGHEAGRASENFSCPRAPFGQRGFSRESLSYGWNERFLPFGTLSNKVANGDETIVIADSLTVGPADTVLPPQGEVCLATRHRGRANVLFVAGHVGAMSRDEALFEWPRYWDRE